MSPATVDHFTSAALLGGVGFILAAVGAFIVLLGILPMELVLLQRVVTVHIVLRCGVKKFARRHATPHDATPRHTTPRRATPRYATPHHTTPRHHRSPTVSNGLI